MSKFNFLVHFTLACQGGAPSGPPQTGCCPGVAPSLRGCPNAPSHKYLHPKGAAASPPPTVAVNMGFRGCNGTPPQTRCCPGVAPSLRGSTGCPLKRKYILEYGEASGVRILQLFFIFCILNEEEQKTLFLAASRSDVMIMPLRN